MGKKYILTPLFLTSRRLHSKEVLLTISHCVFFYTKIDYKFYKVPLEMWMALESSIADVNCVITILIVSPVSFFFYQYFFGQGVIYKN
jgi:hypothetical protein